MVMEANSDTTSDAEDLARLGYRQELKRTWSGFHNFAISFSIICILSGCFASFGQAWNNGGPAVIAIGWPVICGFILVIALCMAELLSAYPTSGGLYWWAAKLAGPKAGYYTGWFNLIGLMAAVAAVSYGAATFIDATISSYSADWAAGYSLTRLFVIFAAILAVAVISNVLGGRLMPLFMNFFVWWLLAGTVIIVLVLLLVPDGHQSASWVFTHRINNSGFANGSTSGLHFWMYIFPLGFLLTQFTVTGFGSSAHMSEETEGAARTAAKGMWRAVLYCALGGWILELALLFAVQPNGGEGTVTAAGGTAYAVVTQAMSPNWAGFVLLISSVAQVFCAVAVLTSTSRMIFAFSRDGAIPGSRYWSRLNADKVPAHATLLAAGVAFVITLPALVTVKIGEAPVPLAFYAIVSVTVVGLFLAYGIPIALRWTNRDRFTPGPWTLGRHFRWMCPVAVAEIAVVSVFFLLPTTPAGVPFSDDFSWKFLNYAPVLTLGSLILLWVWWHLSVKKWFKGPIANTDAAAAQER